MSRLNKTLLESLDNLDSFTSYTLDENESIKESSFEEIVIDSYNHITGDLGRDPVIDAIVDDIISNYDQDYISGESFEDLDRAFKDVKYVLRKEGLKWLDEKQNTKLNEDVSDITKAVEETKPKDNKYLVFDFDVNEEDGEVSLICHGTEAIDDIDEDSDIDLDNKAIDMIETWAKRLAKRIPALRDSIESEIDSDWYSGMSVFGEHGPHTYDGFTLFLYIEE